MLHNTLWKGIVRRSVLPACMVLLLAGCAAQPPYQGGGNGGYYGDRNGPAQACQRCGIVRNVREAWVRDNSDARVLGTIIGAVAGGLIGNTMGDGDGRTAMTTAGALIGGVIGGNVAQNSSAGEPRRVWRVVVDLDTGQVATVTQREAPRVRPGDRVVIRNDRVYLR